MAAIFDATAELAISGTGPYDMSTMTVGAGSNRALVAIIQPADNGVVSAVWDQGGTNQSMTEIGEIGVGTTKGLLLYGLLAPTSGNKTFRLTTDGSGFGFIGLVSFTNVDQGSFATTFLHFNSATGTSTSASVTITTASGNAVVGAFATATAANVNSVNNNQLFLESGANAKGAGNYVITSGSSEVMTGTLASSVAWNAAGVDVLGLASGDVLMPQIWM